MSNKSTSFGEDKPVFPDENENNLSADSSINGKLDAANETPRRAAHRHRHHGGARPQSEIEVSKFECFCRLWGDVCFLIEVVISQPLPSLSGDYVMQRDRAESSQLVTPILISYHITRKGLEAKLVMHFPVLPKNLVIFVEHLPSNYLFKDSCAKLDGDHDPLGETRTQNVPRHHFLPLPPSSWSVPAFQTLPQSLLARVHRQRGLSHRKRRLRVKLPSELICASAASKCSPWRAIGGPWWSRLGGWRRWILYIQHALEMDLIICPHFRQTRTSLSGMRRNWRHALVSCPW